MNPSGSPGTVRPSGIEEEREKEEKEEREETDQEHKVKMRSTEAVPSEREVEEHNVDHAVFCAWCSHCVKGRGEAYGHMKLKDKVKDVPVVSVYYAYMHPEAEEEDEAEKGMPILVTKDSRTKMVYSRVVPKKGLDDYAVGALKRITEELGYKKVVMKSDNEPSILQLKDLVRKETDVELVMEEVPVGDHASNGSVENAVKNIQGQFRVLKDALESRLGVRIQGDHVVVPWLVMHAGYVGGGSTMRA